MGYPKKPLVDYFQNLIEVGDAYFYGSPPQAGIVTKVSRTSIEVTYDGKVWDTNINKWVPGKVVLKCKSPHRGVCLDKKGFV